MAVSPYAWGIDIGRCALKALRCRVSPTDPRKLVADAFDYIEYPTMLTQADADPVALVRDALQEFTSRNQLQGDCVAVSAPGQSGLAKFIKLPPIEARKIPDIVKYEANQQIPFPLDQVEWAWQRLAGGFEESGFVMDAEVALFAMKREQVAKVLAPFEEAGVRIDVLQLAPIALVNMLTFDQLPPADPDNPPPSTVLVSIGVDSTDVVVTNGLRIWQRSMPMGGSSFTKALVTDMQLTFAKAEQQKRNAVRASDPRAVFKSMRPVFKEFASELQRSLNYHTGTDRSAKIGRVLLLGNAAKLRGLSDFVGKELQLDVQRLEKFAALEGSAVLSAPAFRENRLAFGTAYGLALQAAQAAVLRTNLLPKEILRDRIIASKKPWAVAAMLGLLAAGLLNYAGWFVAWQTFLPRKFEPSLAAAEKTTKDSRDAEEALRQVQQKRDQAAGWQQYLVQAHDRRFQALDMMRVVQSLLPNDKLDDPDPAQRRELHVDRMDMQFFPDLAVWFSGVRGEWENTVRAAGGDPGAPPPPPVDQAAAADPATVAPDPGTAAAAAPARAPSGPGWVVQFSGHHFHNDDPAERLEGEQFVRATFVRNMLSNDKNFTVSAGPKATPDQKLSARQMGIDFPVIVETSTVSDVVVPKSAAPVETAIAAGPEAPAAESRGVPLKRYDFVLQFVWQPSPPPAPAAAGTATP
jgi:type IV pilus assembly protein PilM